LKFDRRYVSPIAFRMDCTNLTHPCQSTWCFRNSLNHRPLWIRTYYIPLVRIITLSLMTLV
jgi:hypothetical protein